MPSITITDLTNAKLDVDHIADVANSTASTVTDRLGNAKDTVKGATDSLKAFNSRGAWAASTAYSIKDIVTVSGTWYACVLAHTSSASFATDSSTKWRIHQGLVAADLAAAAGAAGVGTADGSNLQAALNRTPARLGRTSGADLPRFMSMLRRYRNDLQPVIPIVGFGSSVGLGATLATPTVDAPVAWFKSQLKAKFDPGNLFNLTAYNYSVNGSSASEFPASYAALLAAGVTQPGIAVLCYGMNDQQPALYNSGQTFEGFYPGMRDAITTLRKAGWDVVVMTTPHASIVKNPSLNAMPSNVPQIYPTSINAPVGPEQMKPPASASNITADFIGEGTAITVSHRALRINHAMRDACREFGAVLIDTERYWFEALQKFQIQTGSAAGAEGVLFNTGETVHPNLVGHQNSYQASINDFVKSLAWQAAQPNVAPRLNGYYGMNLGDVLPTAVLEAQATYGDAVTPPLAANVPVGPVDANGIKGMIRAFEIDPANGDVNLFGGAYRLKSYRVSNGTLSDGVGSVKRPYGGTFTDIDQGDINNSTTWTLKAFPDNSAGRLMINGTNTGISTSPQVNEWLWKTKGGVLTLTALPTAIGSAVYTVAVSGLSVVATPLAANTNFQASWKALGA